MDILKGYIADPYERYAFAEFLKDAFGRHKNPYKVCIWKTTGPSGTTTLEKLIFKAFEATGTKDSCRLFFSCFGIRKRILLNRHELRLAFESGQEPDMNEFMNYVVHEFDEVPVIYHSQTAIPDEIELREDVLIVNLTPLNTANMRSRFAFDDAQVTDFKRMLFED